MRVYAILYFNVHNIIINHQQASSTASKTKAKIQNCQPDIEEQSLRSQTTYSPNFSKTVVVNTAHNLKRKRI